MELQEMKALWKVDNTTPISITEIEKMTLENSHPMLRKIKRQLLLEMILWIIILFGYHNAFDGAKRPGAINLIFVAGLVQAVAYNFAGYCAARNLIAGSDLSTSFHNYLKKLRRFRWTAICSRAVLMLGVILFFSYGLEMQTKRIVGIAGITTMFGIQLLLISMSWNKRIEKLGGIAESLKN
ncbi:hypothetical protein [Pedobacter duraquae]|uniref:Uncharacterized protein n=1 Tax=Pedobacter duraquae TaxID=425511 RepID=A0A4R6IGG3_9SPHI|nr:hypothetical protein [Pedobacter duraquae]TDO20861.1 hypothetical protein CLV32_3496 [Pedobacter duraquae]